MENRKIALLGGSFDPIHLGHLALAEEVYSRMELDAVWFLPAHISPNKNHTGASPEDRLSMVKCALDGKEAFEVCDLEINRGGISYTHETLESLKSRFPEVIWYWILGLDTFLDFPKWKNYKKIMQMAHLVVAPRPGVENGQILDTLKQLGGEKKIDPGKILPDHGVHSFDIEGTGHAVFFLGGPRMDISSTVIRSEWAPNPQIKKMLPPPVVQYIMNHQLYV